MCRVAHCAIRSRTRLRVELVLVLGRPEQRSQPSVSKVADAWQGFRTCSREESLLLRGVRKALGNRSCMKFAFIVIRAQANHLVTILDLAGVNSVRLLIAVMLAAPLGGGVVNHGFVGVHVPHM